MPLPRPLSPAEQREYRAAFPLLDVTEVVVTGEVDYDYNCLAWTLGLTSVWIWPGSTLTDFDNLYSMYGFNRVKSGSVAVYGATTHEMMHGTIRSSVFRRRWESKCGSGLRIQHGLHELESGAYGNLIAQYGTLKSVTRADSFRKHVEKIAKGRAVKTYLTREQAEELARDIERLPQARRDDYRKAFERWKETWFRGGLQTSSNPTHRRIGPDFSALVAMGPGILPLVVQSLADPANFFALQLYDTLQSDPHRRVEYESDDERVFEGEQGRARRTVEVWFANQ